MTEKLKFFTFKKLDEAKQFAEGAVFGFYSNPGTSSVVALLFSVMMTRGLNSLASDMDSADLPLMGAHG